MFPMVSPRSHMWPDDWEKEEIKVDFEALKKDAEAARNAGTAYASAARVNLAGYGRAAAVNAQLYIAKADKAAVSAEERMEALLRAERAIATPAAGGRSQRPLKGLLGMGGMI